MTTDTQTFHVSLAEAESYESRFVPRLFAAWAPLLVDAAGVSAGHRVLDVATGTGIVARTAAERVGMRWRVVGLDLNPAMLVVAKRQRRDVEWREGDAASMPFLARSFDVVLCQASLMFFPDVTGALAEMARVVRDGGTVAVQVWDRLEDQPAYRPFIDVAARHAGPDAIDLLGSYFARGDLHELTSLMRAASLKPMTARTEATTLHFDSVDELVTTEVQSTPLGDYLTDDVLSRIIEDSRDALRAFQRPDGRLDIPIRGHVVTATRR
jgi:ubiquinone/menaquinone biosynthesis C-methylase UbiE